MKKFLPIFILISLIWPFWGQADASANKPINFTAKGDGASAVLTWENPDDYEFSETILFRSTIPIFEYFTYQAVEGLCDKIYAGTAETFTDTGLAVNLPYYYILFARNQAGEYSGAVIAEKKSPAEVKKQNPIPENNSSTLAGASSAIVNEVSLDEAKIVYNYNQTLDMENDENARRLALFIIVKSPHDLAEKDKNAISYFIHAGTPTTIVLGSGERAGVLNSYLSVFDKLPRNTLEWQDVIKIANGRWPNERNIASEEKAADVFFGAIYERKPDMDNPNDNAAVTVIAYGLRPAQRNMESEKNAIEIYRAIFKKSPSAASDWDLVRAIAYSGASR